MDDGGYVEAQPGTINYNDGAPEPEPEPWTWIETTMLCLCTACSVGTVAGGVVIVHVRRPSHPGGDTVAFVTRWIIIALGFFAMALVAFLVVTEFRASRKVEAMTRLHMVPVSRR